MCHTHTQTQTAHESKSKLKWKLFCLCQLYSRFAALRQSVTVMCHRNGFTSILTAVAAVVSSRVVIIVGTETCRIFSSFFGYHLNLSHAISLNNNLEREKEKNAIQFGTTTAQTYTLHTWLTQIIGDMNSNGHSPFWIVNSRAASHRSIFILLL